MSFQSVILTIAIIVLIGILIFIGVMLSKSSSSGANWPPIVGECPDYWIDASTDPTAPPGSSCLNTKSLGTCNIPSVGAPDTKDFTTSVFTGTNPTCAKYTWAKTCGVTWDGITSGISQPCDTSS